ncbi:DUF3558 family protein [Nocardia yamanashiensis]|uniref:DUF3558 family protein n=1 Tax=Nocardia yamanashiensis TaxID=209247 RepID=UPI000836699D|nr:DUF3558 family protein [Nocardia yamanashiensis]
MRHAKSKGVLISALGAALVLSGCSSSDDKGASETKSSVSTSAAAPTTTAAGSSTGGGESTPGGGNATVAPELTLATTSPAQTESGKPAAMWDACGIADADITRLGFQAGSKQVIDGADGERNCRWQSASGKSEITIGSTRQTLDEFKQSGRYVGFTQVQAGGHAATQYRAAQDTNKTGCYISFPVAGGQTLFVTRNLKSDAPEPCEATLRVVNGLSPYLN